MLVMACGQPRTRAPTDHAADAGGSGLIDVDIGSCDGSDGRGSVPDAAETRGGPLSLPYGQVPVPAGSFFRGAHDDEACVSPDETPRHHVTLTRSLIVLDHEITAEEWAQTTGLPVPGIEIGADSELLCTQPDCPVAYVNWFEAARFANLLSEQQGLVPCYRLTGCTGTFGGGCTEFTLCEGDFTCEAVDWPSAACTGWRLPTESEWEYLARAGTGGAFAFPYPAGGLKNINCTQCEPEQNLDHAGWFCANSDLKSHPVRQLIPNSALIYDASGNVYEWCFDWKGAYPQDDVVDPVGPASAQQRVARGGSFLDNPRHCRLAYRNGFHPALRARNLGMRLVRNADAPGLTAKSDPSDPLPCTPSDGCGEESGQFCGVDGFCVPCDNALHCGPKCVVCTMPTPVCVDGACAECPDDGYCPQGEWCKLGTCVPCTQDDPDHCGPTCEKCHSSAPSCIAGKCRCEGGSCGPWQECIAGKCELCNVPSRCGESCLPCPLELPLCRFDALDCVECLTASDCAPGMTCKDGECIPDCVAQGCHGLPLFPGQDCESPPAVGRIFLHEGVILAGNTAASPGFQDSAGTGSSCPDSAQEQLVVVYLVAGDTLSARLAPMDPKFDATLKLRSGKGCADALPELLSCSPGGGDGGLEELVHTASQDGWVTVIVDGAQADKAAHDFGFYLLELDLACSAEGCCCL